LNVDNVKRSPPLKKEERIVISGQQIEAAVLRAQGYSLNEIAKELRLAPQSVQRSLKSLEKTYPILRQCVDELRRIGYQSKRLSSRELVERANRAKDQRAREGYHIGPAPFGYIKRHGMLEVDPEKAEIVKRIFNGRLEGKTYKQLSEETGLPYGAYGTIVKNPVYCGKLSWRGIVLQGRHDPIIDEEKWRRAQSSLGDKPYMPMRPPLGYKRIIDHLVVDPEGAEKVRQIFSLRLKRKTVPSISKRLGIKKGVIYTVLMHPVYMGKISTNEGYSDIDVPKIIDPRDWWAAQRISRVDVAQVMQRERGIERRRKILSCLPSTTTEITKHINQSHPTVRHHLMLLERTGIIKRHSDGRWYRRDPRSERLEQMMRDKGWQILKGDRALATRDAVLKALISGPATRGEIAERSKISPPKVSHWLRRFEADGIVTRDADGKWHINPEAAEFLQEMWGMIEEIRRSSIKMDW